MPTYEYTARDSRGRIARGVVEAASRLGALTKLQGEHLTATGLTEVGAEKAGPKIEELAPVPKKRSLFARVTTSDKAIFCRQLAVSVSSGIPLRESLDGVMSDMDNLVMKQVLQRVIQRLTDGLPFSQAIDVEPQVFDRLFVSLIKAAEESGSMSETLEYLAGNIEKADRLARKVRSIMAYPIFIAGFFVVISLIMTLFVLPRFQAIFASYGSDLPGLTRFVLGVNGFIIRHSLLIFAGLAGIVAGVVMYVRTPKGRFQWDTLMLKTPLVGSIARKIAVSRFARNMGMMIRGGVSAATAMEIAAEILGNKVLEATLIRAHQRVISGSDIASSLDASVFPCLVIRMVAVGESSGRLPEVMEKVADVYDDQVEGSILVATALFEPIAISVFGAVVLVLVLSIYLPIFTMASHMR